MVAAQPSIDLIWTMLGRIADPEIPVLSIRDLGIVRQVAWSGDELVIAVTPTYSGCPATEVIKAEIGRAMREAGLDRVRIETQLSPAWTTDWISDEVKQRLTSYGIAAPGRLIEIQPAVTCPQCGSASTQMVSRFGSTPCKALYRCRECLEPFDVFKRY